MFFVCSGNKSLLIILNNLFLSFKVSELTVETYGNYIKMFTNFPYFNYFVDWIQSWLEELSRTDLGFKFIGMIPG